MARWVHDHKTIFASAHEAARSAMKWQAARGVAGSYADAFRCALRARYGASKAAKREREWNADCNAAAQRYYGSETAHLVHVNERGTRW